LVVVVDSLVDIGLVVASAGAEDGPHTQDPFRILVGDRPQRRQAWKEHQKESSLA
jgi:hypothetical protein